MNKFKKGDYVLGTKYSDGDPHDGWAVGFVSEMAYEEGAKIVDNQGKIIGRFNGFRRVKKINGPRGDWLCRNAQKFESLPHSMWHYFRCSKKEQLAIDNL